MTGLHLLLEVNLCRDVPRAPRAKNQSMVYIFTDIGMMMQVPLGDKKDFMAAIRKGDVNAVKRIITTNPAVCTSNPNVQKGDHPLHLAARLGFTDVVDALLEQSSVNITNNDGKAALHEAASNGHVDVLQLLIERGAVVDCLKAADW